MNFLNELQHAAQRASESPKTTAIVSTVSSAAGLATAGQWLTGLAAGLAVFAGLGCSLALMRLHLINAKNERIRTKMLIEEARRMGLHITEDAA